MKLTKAEREQIKNKCKGKCAYCGIVLKDGFHADHLDPVFRQYNGEMWKSVNDRFDNLMPSCPPCNIDKHAMDLERWRTRLQDTVKVLLRNSSTYRHAKRFGLVQETNRNVIFYFESLNNLTPTGLKI